MTWKAGVDHLTKEQAEVLISVDRAAMEEMDVCKGKIDLFKRTIFFALILLLQLIFLVDIIATRNPAGTRRVCEKICGTVMSNWVFFRTKR
jgi:hypothetical protein